MTRLPALKPKKVLQALKRAGFFVHHTRGSHYYLKHVEKPGLLITLPFHGKDLKRRTLSSILEQADLTPEEFLDWL